MLAGQFVGELSEARTLPWQFVKLFGPAPQASVKFWLIVLGFILG